MKTPTSLTFALLLSSVALATEQKPSPSPTAAPPSAQAVATPSAEQLADFVTYVEWVFDVPLTNAQRDEAARLVNEAWAQSSEGGKQIVRNALAAKADFVNYSDGEREALRASVADEYGKILAMQYKGEPLARWIQGVREASRRPDAPGRPQLARQDTDALAELLALVLSESGLSPGFTADLTFRTAMGRAIAEEFATYSEEQRTAVADMARRWAAFQARWSAMPEAKKTQLRAGWAQTLHPLYATSSGTGGAGTVTTASSKPTAATTGQVPAKQQLALDRLRLVARQLSTSVNDWQ